MKGTSFEEKFRRCCETVTNVCKNLDPYSLLEIEKDRRGRSKTELLFIGMANVASYWWCARKAVLKSRLREIEFFASYFLDRLLYSMLLGYVDQLPATPEKLLDVGDEITLNDIEKLLWEEISQDADSEKVSDDINEKLAELGIDPADLEKDSMLRGKVYEKLKMERYPTIRWNFEWRDYVVVGIPDGITEEFVYEFKTTKSNFLFRYIERVALTQADLYGYFFKRDKKRVQVYVIQQDSVLSFDGQVDVSRAEETLDKFQQADTDLDSAIYPIDWKCNSCEFRELC